MVVIFCPVLWMTWDFGIGSGMLIVIKNVLQYKNRKAGRGRNDIA